MAWSIQNFVRFANSRKMWGRIESHTHTKCCIKSDRIKIDAMKWNQIDWNGIKLELYLCDTQSEVKMGINTGFECQYLNNIRYGFLLDFFLSLRRFSFWIYYFSFCNSSNPIIFFWIESIAFRWCTSTTTFSTFHEYMLCTSFTNVNIWAKQYKHSLASELHPMKMECMFEFHYRTPTEFDIE